MATPQALIELKKIKKLLKPAEKKITKTRKRAKKIKLKDLFKGESLNERISNFLDKLTLDDVLKLSAFVSLAVLIYPFVYNLKPRGFWVNVMKNARFLQIIGWISLVPLMKQDPELDMGVMAVSIVTSYLFIYQGGSIKDIAKGIIAVL